MTDRQLAATDGATLPTNPGPSGWAYVLAGPDGQVAQTVSAPMGWGTNNQAELTAIREVLKATEGPITIRSDSEYAINCLTKWLDGWRRRGWKNSKKQPVMNRELIDETARLMEGRDVQLTWVRAHQVGGDSLNAAADEAANTAARDCAAESVDETVPCPDCGSSVTGDAGLYACSCGRIFEAAPMDGSPSRPTAAAGLPRARAGGARSKSGTKPARVATVKAKFPGRCHCGRPDEPGEMISKNPDGWGHLDCMASTTGR